MGHLRVLVFDLPGNGSSSTSEGHDIHSVARDLMDLLSEWTTAGFKLHLCAHIASGEIAVLLAEKIQHLSQNLSSITLLAPWITPLPSPDVREGFQSMIDAA